MHEQGQYASKRAQANGHNEQHGKDHFIDRARRIHQATHRLVHPTRGDIGRGQEPKRDRKNHRQHRAPQSNLDRDHHFGQVERPLGKFRREEISCIGGHVASVTNQVQGSHIGAPPRTRQQG